MPTRPTKGDHGHADGGSSGRGGQKATYGSAVDPDVAAGRAEAEAEAAARRGAEDDDREP
jgi:hypothetical protein